MWSLGWLWKGKKKAVRNKSIHHLSSLHGEKENRKKITMYNQLRCICVGCMSESVGDVIVWFIKNSPFWISFGIYKKNECDCCESDLGGAGCILHSDSPILCVKIINAMTLCVPPRDPGGFGEYQRIKCLRLKMARKSVYGKRRCVSLKFQYLQLLFVKLKSTHQYK